MFRRKKHKQYKYEIKLTLPSGEDIVIDVSMAPAVWETLDEVSFVDILVKQFLTKTQELRNTK